jgi:subtilisin-like proprotein convertase family protein
MNLRRISKPCSRWHAWRSHSAAATLMLLALLWPSLSRATAMDAPVFSPPDGTRLPALVSLASPDTNATVYYTLDGTVPGTNSPVYAAPLNLTQFTVVRARSFRAGFDASDTVFAGYYPAAEAPSEVTLRRQITNDLPATPLVTLTMTNPTGARCFVVEEQLPPTAQAVSVDASGQWLAGRKVIRWGPFVDATSAVGSYRLAGMAGDYTVNAAISADGQTMTGGHPDVVTITIVQTNLPATNAPIVITPPPQVALPVISPNGSTNLPVDVSLRCATTNAAIYYALDGTLPGTNSLLYTTNAIHLTEPGLVRARAFLAGWVPSVAAVANFGTFLPPPDLGMAYQVLTNGASTLQVTMSAAPDSNQVCAVVEQWIPSGLVVANVTAAGVFNPATRSVKWGPFWGTNVPALSFEISGLGGPASIRTRWSVDGRGNERWLAVNLPVTGIGGSNGVGNVTLPTQPTPLPAPVMSPSGSTNLPVDVAMTCADALAEIRYTMDGTVPGTNSTLYSAALHLTADTVVRARAFRAGMTPSDTVFGDFRQVQSQTALSLVRSITGSGQYRPAVTITANPGTGVECYTITEVLPAGLSASDVGQIGIWNPATHTIKWGPFFGGARVLTYRVSGPTAAYRLSGTGSFDGYSTPVTGDVAVAVDLATMPQVAAVTFSPTPDGIFPADVTIACATAGAVIHYTLDGSIPDETSPVYAGPVRLPTVTLLSARAFKEWMVPGPTTQVLYGNEVPPGGTNAVMLVRSISGNGNDRRNVSLSVQPVSNVLCYAVSEVLPAGLVPVHISGGGVFSAKSQTIRWGPFMDSQARRLTYAVTGPDGAFDVAGSLSFNGYSVATSGDKTVLLNNTPVVWHRLIGGAGMGPDTVIVAAQLPAGASCYTVEEFLPAGMTPTAISDGGVWSTNTLAIKWGPFEDDQSRNLSYQVSSVGSAALRCHLSVDGVGHDLSQELVPPTISACLTNLTLALAPANCAALVPDVTPSVIATDNVTGTNALMVWQNPPAGAWIGWGSTQIVVYVADAADNFTTCTTLVSVVDQTLPQLVAPPAPVSVLPGETATFTADVLSCSPLTYQWFFNGTTPVGGNSPILTLTNVAGSQQGLYSVVVSNANGAAPGGQAQLTVIDIVPPVMTIPPDMLVTTTNPAGAVVSFGVPATDDRGTVTVSSTPASGTLFPLGTSTVRCLATDGSGNTSSGSFQVTVFFWQSANQVVNHEITDNSPAGYSSSIFLTSPIVSISNVTVTLTISNGWNGDLYARLVHSSGQAILLNRVGRTAQTLYGYGDAGFEGVAFDDNATNGDVHLYRLASPTNWNQMRGDALTGVWAPDGRTNEPPAVLDTDARTAPLAVFKGLRADGEWTLFIADYGPKDTSTLVSWGLDITGSLAQPSMRLAGAAFQNGQLGFSYIGTANRTVLVQRSTNLLDWITIETNIIPATGVISITDTNPPPGRGFYRTLEP